MMKFLGLISLLFAFTAQAGTMTIKCWTNEEGVRECGSAVPAQYSRQGYEEMNPETGLTIKEVAAEKSPEEIEKLKAQEVIEAQQKAAAEAQKRADQALLDTFPTAEDIDMARDAKLLSVAAAVKVAKSRIEDYQRNLTATKEAMAQNQPEGEELSKIQHYITQLETQLEKAQGIVLQKQQERENIIAEYKNYKQRFFAIKNAR